MSSRSPERNDGAAESGEGTDRAATGEEGVRTLTDRQLEILSQVARGRTNRQVGEALGISERTARNHMRMIGKRLGATDRTHAVVLAIGHGWIAIPIEPEPQISLAQPRPAESAT